MCQKPSSAVRRPARGVSLKSDLADALAPKQPFDPAIPWEARTWLWNERLMYRMTKSKMLALGVGLPLALLICFLVVVFFPLAVLVVSLSTTPRQTGAFVVGQHDLFHAVGGAELRVRIWYPAESSSAGRPWWLPGRLGTRLRYASSYALDLGLPRWLAFVFGFPLALVRTPAKCDPPALAPEAGGAWPVVFFSHGLLGTVSAYAALCAEVASHGAVVVTLEHTDGSAAFTQLGDGSEQSYCKARPDKYTGEGADQVWRRAQTRARAAQSLGLLRSLGAALGPTPVGPLVRAGQLESRRVALMGHSFGGATVWEAATELAASAEMEVSALLLLDPWMLGCSESVYEAKTHAPPTLVAMTPTLMWPDNAALIGRALRAFPRGMDSPPIYVEAAGTRHQEASDFPALAYLVLRLTCMAGHLRARTSLGLFCDAAVGFLATSGAQRERGGPHQAQAARMVQSWYATIQGEAPADDKAWIIHN